MMPVDFFEETACLKTIMATTARVEKRNSTRVPRSRRYGAPAHGAGVEQPRGLGPFATLEVKGGVWIDTRMSCPVLLKPCGEPACSWGCYMRAARSGADGQLWRQLLSHQISSKPVIIFWGSAWAKNSHSAKKQMPAEKGMYQPR